MNTARVEPGASVCVIGCGGVGLSVVMGAVLAGAHPIIAVDVEDAKLEQARDLGATHAVRGDGDVAAAVKAIVPGGVDYAFEAIGLRPTIELMPDSPLPGGRGRHGRHDGGGRPRELLGLRHGRVRAQRARLELRLVRGAHRLPADRRAVRGREAPDRPADHPPIALEEVNEAFDDMRERRGGRAVILYD